MWVGVKPGVYSNWNECQLQIKNYPAAKYISAKSKAEAEALYALPWQEVLGSGSDRARGNLTAAKTVLNLPPDFTHGIAVDASSIGNPGKMEYRGVDSLTGEEIFRSKVYPVGTNNIGEFLAIVHALALFHESNPTIPVYTDSRTAMSWIKAKKCRTKLPASPATAALMAVIARAEQWLATHRWTNPLRKWETDQWGEIPADFGRK